MTARQWRACCAHGCDWLGPVRDDPATAQRDGEDHALAVQVHEIPGDER